MYIVVCGGTYVFIGDGVDVLLEADRLDLMSVFELTPREHGADVETPHPRH